MKKNLISLILGLAVGAVAAVSTPVRAATLVNVGSCTVQYVQFQNQQFAVKCTEYANEFFAYGPSLTTCGSRVELETLKAFNTTAQAALLAGRHLWFNYNPDPSCPGNISINIMRMF